MTAEAPRVTPDQLREWAECADKRTFNCVRLANRDARWLADELDRLALLQLRAMGASAELHALAEDYRNDWSDFDGRTLRREVNEILAPLDAVLAGVCG